MAQAIQKVHGVMIGVVTNVDDPQGEGRIRVRLTSRGGKSELYWAPIASAMAGNDYGAFLMPQVGDEAVIGFDRGDVHRPYVLGFLWSAKNRPPSTAVRERMLRSVNGHTIRLIDATPENGNSGAVVIEDAQGNHVTLSNGKVTVRSVAVIEIEAPTIILKGPGYRRVVVPNSNPI
ncbi:MAG TPA: phage baseplate assembly protein V [Burkholderiales bacterium]|nr:phage baseplate assembly protein V [Burkholderiales bacterium]